jgi:hypothetical protein
MMSGKPSFISSPGIPRLATLSGTGEESAKFGGAGKAQANVGVLGSFFFHDLDTPLYLLLVYAKAVRTDLSRDAQKAVREFAERIKQAHRRPGVRRSR